MVARLLFSAGGHLGSMVPAGYPATVVMSDFSSDGTVHNQHSLEHKAERFRQVKREEEEEEEEEDEDTAVSTKWSTVMSSVLGPLEEPPTLKLRLAVCSFS